MKFIEFTDPDQLTPRPIEEKELFRIIITPRGKKVGKRTAIGGGAIMGAVVAVALNRSIKARAVAQTIAQAANDVKEEVRA